jgi:gliding motility-associated-like protein
VTDASLCATNLQVVIGSPSELEVTLTSTNPSCGLTDGAIVSTVSGGTTPYTNLWSPGNQTSTSLTNVGSGTYSLTVTDANGCSASASSTLAVSGGLTVEITPPNATLSAGESVVLTASVQGLTSGVTYTWTPATGLSCTDCASPTASPSVTTTYTVSAETADGCQGSEQVTITIEEDCGEYFMPTIFSPNGDLNNDELCLLGNCISSMDLKIYNRWGELVFQSSNQNDCWDGTFKGAALNPASFVYVLKLTFSDGSEIEENGNVSLVR